MALPTIVNATGIARLTLKSDLACSVGDLIGHNGTDWVLADADARIPASYMAMETVAAGSVVSVCQAGALFDSDAPYTAGQDQYLATTAGGHTSTIPSLTTTLTILQRIGKTLSTDTVIFDLTPRGPTLLRARVAYDPASLASATARSDTVTITGLLTTDVVRGRHVAVLTGTGWDTGLDIVSLDVSGADTLRVRLQNATAGALDGASVNLDVYIERL
jgi:hypothetical protein